MIGSDYTLELSNVYHSGQVEPGTCFQRVTGGIKTGVILKDVSFAIQSGEVMAILGSKGSGKRALLDVIARRVPSRGHLLLEGSPLTASQFKSTCGFVRHSTKLLPGLSVYQKLSLSLTKISGYLKTSKVKQVMADLALSQVANKSITSLTKSEYRRLVIGVQLIRDPDKIIKNPNINYLCFLKTGKQTSEFSLLERMWLVSSYKGFRGIIFDLYITVILLLDEPTWDLDPLNTYLVVSILSNAAKKYGTTIVLTMEKPRSDVFPFLDRVVYLCLGDVVYAGPTRHLLDYFGSIGFPCPQLENPLMYYLCLSTVDRRSRERFIESNEQIAALVNKFKTESPGFVHGHTMEHARILNPNKMQLNYGNIGWFSAFWMLYVRMLTSIFNFNVAGLKQMAMRLFMLPIYTFIMWLFYKDVQNFQHAFTSTSGLIFNLMAGSYFIAILNTICLYAPYRTRYYEESQEGLYGGGSMLTAHNLVSLPFSLFTTFAATAIVFPIIGDFSEPLDYVYFSLSLWACYIFAEQQTMAVMLLIKDPLLAACTSVYIAAIYLQYSSGVLRSYKGFEDWLYYLTYATQPRYASISLHRIVFDQDKFVNRVLPYDSRRNCSELSIQTGNNFAQNTNPFCKYSNGKAFMLERFSHSTWNGDVYATGDLDIGFNLGVSFAFAVGSILFNLVFYAIPLPAFVKDKFRE